MTPGNACEVKRAYKRKFGIQTYSLIIQTGSAEYPRTRPTHHSDFISSSIKANMLVGTASFYYRKRQRVLSDGGSFREGSIAALWRPHVRWQ